MKKIVRTKTSYRCGVCRSEHARKAEAAACETGGIETRAFRVGDTVAAKEKRTCPHGHDYVCRGRVVRVVGPVPYDAEIYGKGFGLWRSGGHIFLYELIARCTRCTSRTPVRYPAISLKRTPSASRAR